MPCLGGAGIGYAVKSVPAVVESSEVVGQWLGALLLLYFGARTLRDAWMQSDDADAGEELEEAEESGGCAQSGRWSWCSRYWKCRRSSRREGNTPIGRAWG